MIDKIIKYCALRPASGVAGAFILMAGSIFAYRELPIDAVPDVTNVQVQINTAVPALSPATTEATITYPVESAMSAIPNARETRSITRYGLSQVTVVFEEGTDIYLARQLVAERLSEVELPEGINPSMGPISSGLGEIYFYTLEAQTPAKNPEERLRQLMQLRTIQEWEIKPRLLYVSGVAEVNTIGGYPEQYYVQPDLKKMAAYGIHLDELEDALRENNRNAGGGYLNQSADQIIVQANGLLKNTAAIAAVPVKKLPDFTVITVGEVARVGPDRELRTGAALYNGNETVVGTVMMLLGENSRTVALDVDATIQEIKRGLPEWVELKTVYNRSELVNATIGTVRSNLLFGAALVAVVLMLLTGNLRAAAVTALVIPLSLGATLIGMYFFGVSANLMSLGALDFGVIVDGAVIVMDACARGVTEKANRLKRPLSRSEIRSAVAESTVAIRRAAGFGQLIILVVFLPVFALTGVEGKMFQPMAGAFCLALTAAFILAFTVVPAIAGSVLGGRPGPEDNRLMSTLGALYAKALNGAARFRYAVYGLAVFLTVLGLGLFVRLGGEFIPQLYEGSLAVQFVRPVSINLPQSLELEKLSHRTLREFPEVRGVVSRIGTSEIATDPMGVNIADTYALLHPRDQWPEIDGNRRTPSELFEAVREKLETDLAGQSILLSQPIQLRFNELLEGTRADVSLKIFGEDLEQLETLARRIAALVQQIPGAGDVESEIRGKSPILHVNPRDDVLRRLGLSRKELLDSVQSGLGGHEVGYLYRGVRRFPLLIRLKEEDRQSLDRIRELPVGVQENQTVPLSRIADLEFAPAYLTIRREMSKRRVAVLINPRGRDTQSLVREAMERVEKEVTLPPGYYLEWGGNFRNLQQARARLAIIAPIALAVIFFMIYAAFGNFPETILVFLLVPVALAGGVLSLALRGMPFSISAGVGFIAVSGIAVLNGVVLISFANQLKQAGRSGFDLAREAGRSRLRAVLMTATTDIVGFLPMMLATGMGAEVQRPLATVVIGGIFTATFATLILLPLLIPSVERLTDLSKAGGAGH